MALSALKMFAPYSDNSGLAPGGRGNGGATRIAIWQDANTLTSDAALTYTSETVKIQANNPKFYAFAANTANNNAVFLAQVGGTTANDAYSQYSVSGATDWVVGVDNSVASDPFKICYGTALGTNDYFVITSTGNITGSAAVAAGALVWAVQNTDTSGRSRLRAQGNDGDGLVDYRNSAHSTSGVLLASQAVFRGTGPGGAAFGSENATGSVLFFAGGTAAGNQYGSISPAGVWVIGTGTSTTHRLNTSVQTTVGAAGGASALPATPTGYVLININGTDRAIPYYASA